jgi:hypothetical protein
MRSREKKRFRDKYVVGKSNTVPYIENESWDERHKRRKHEAIKRKKEVEMWCLGAGWKFRTANNEHHWIFITAQRKMVEWFPSSGKFSIGKQWQETIHMHDVDQLITVLETCREAEENGKSRNNGSKR